MNYIYGSKMSRMKDICLSEPALHAHHNSLLDGLNKLREKGELIDITLIVDEMEYKAHKAVLAACSDYFRAMFNGDMLESGKNVIALYGISHTGFKLLLNFMYTAKLDLTSSNVQDVLAAATYLQMSAVIQKCAIYLGTQLDIDNCVDIVTIAETYCLTNLRKTVYYFICKHFEEIAATSNFYRFTPEHIENILKLNLPVDCTETEVLRYVLMWFLHGENSEICGHQQQTQKILKHIHYNQMLLRQMEGTIDKVFSQFNLIKQDHPLYKIILDEARQIGNSSDINLYYVSFNSRGLELALVKIGGFGTSGMTNEITYCLTSEQRWKHLTLIPHVEQCNFGTTVLNNNLYVVGGCFNQSLQEVIHPFGFKYNPRIDQWSKIASLLVERCRFTLNVSGEKLYAIGGATEVESFDGTEGTSSCEVYDPVQDTWQLIEPLPEYRTQHAGASINVNGKEKIYISGGVCRDTVVDSLYCFDIELETWTLCQPMLNPRADHFMLAYGHKLYVCSGWRENSLQNRRRTQVDTIDAYNTLTDSWEIVTHVPTPRYHAGVVADKSKIYIIGGFHTDDMFYKDTAAVECYDILTDKWTCGEKSSQDYWEHCCVTLYIPKTEDYSTKSLPYHINLLE